MFTRTRSVIAAENARDGEANYLRQLKIESLTADLVIVGGGLAGTCCAVTAAREGLRVVLVQDRPVLGGNASSEVRLWALGATSHMGNNNRWAREGGVIDEILVENMWRNPEGNPILFDSILLELVKKEPSIALLLNTAVHELDMRDKETIERVRGYNSQNQTLYEMEAPLFVDASGDGILGFLSGAEFRIGAESATEFGEAMAPSEPEHALLGHSLYFYSRDAGRPVKYVPPAFALQDIEKIPRYRDIRVSDSGCRLWWLEYGGALDTVDQTEEIKWELWSVAYGVWNYIKNSGKFPDAENLTLEWMGTIPGKRESRRFVGDFTLTQNDIVQQTSFEDAVSFGGWAIDLHPAEGVFSAQPGCTQWHSKGVYQIPYRTMYSRNIRNLFLTGRLISVSHIAFGSTRVMATCAGNGQAVGMAAAICRSDKLSPPELVLPRHMHRLQQRLLASGQHIPGVPYWGECDLTRKAQLVSSSCFQIRQLLSSGEVTAPGRAYALLLPVAEGPMPAITLYAQCRQETTMHVELWASSRPGNTTPDLLLECADIKIPRGDKVQVPLGFKYRIAESSHMMLVIPAFPHGALHLSQAQVPGVLTLSQTVNSAVAKSSVQTPPAGSGIDTFAFWLPERRPKARNLAATIEPPIDLCRPEMAINGVARPWRGINAWVPAADDLRPYLKLVWPELQAIRKISLTFDTDFDHPMESVLLSHPERVMPGCITAFTIKSDDGTVIAQMSDNHQTRWNLQFEAPIHTTSLTIEVLEHGDAPPAIFNVSCW